MKTSAASTRVPSKGRSLRTIFGAWEPAPASGGRLELKEPGLGGESAPDPDTRKSRSTCTPQSRNSQAEPVGSLPQGALPGNDNGSPVGEEGKGGSRPEKIPGRDQAPLPSSEKQVEIILLLVSTPSDRFDKSCPWSPRGSSFPLLLLGFIPMPWCSSPDTSGKERPA